MKGKERKTMIQDKTKKKKLILSDELKQKTINYLNSNNFRTLTKSMQTESLQTFRMEV